MAAVVDYVSNIWIHVFKDKVSGPINRVQRIGVKSIVEIFLIVVTSVVVDKIYIVSIQYRFWKRTVKLWTDFNILSQTNFFRRNIAWIKKFRKYYCLPLYQIADISKNIEMESLEIINLFILVL